MLFVIVCYGNVNLAASISIWLHYEVLFTFNNYSESYCDLQLLLKHWMLFEADIYTKASV